MTEIEFRGLSIEEKQEKLVEIFMSKKRRLAMFSSVGNNRVQAFIKKCMKKVVNKKAIRQEDFEAYVSAEAKKVASQEKYEEMGDTAVRECIYYCRSF